MSLFGRKEKRALDALSSELEQRGIALSEDQRSITSIPGYWPDAGFGGQAVASVSRALSLVPVFGAIRTLADSIASLPLNLYCNDSKGIPRRQPTPTLFQNPSIHGTMYDWLFRGVESMALQGDAIGLKTQRDFYGFPTMVEWLNPEQVATQDGKLYGPGSYMNPMWWWWGRPINPQELIHIPWFTMPWRVRGLSPIGAFQLTTNIGIGAQEYQASWFGQGGVPPGTFQNSERTIEQKDADKLTARLTARLQARQPLVYGRDWTYTPIAIKPHEAQFIECAVASTLFTMADGTLLRADELSVGDELVTWDGEKLVASRVSNVAEMPSGRTRKVKTACGRELTTSLEHPYLASRRERTSGKRYHGTLDSNSRWIQARQLRVGDYVRLALDWDAPSDDQIDIETAWAIGVLIGDGCLTNNQVRFSSTDPKIVARLDLWLQRYDAGLVHVSGCDYRVRMGKAVFGLLGSLLHQELSRFRMLGQFAHGSKKRVPEVIMRGGPKVWAAFLAGYLDTDGTVAKASVVWSSVSNQLIQECQHLLTMLGIKSSVRQHTSLDSRMINGQLCICQPSWNLAVCGIRNLRKLAEIVVPEQITKASRLAEFAVANVRENGARSDPRWTRVVSIENAGFQTTYGITVDGTHTHVTNGIVTHNTVQMTATQIATIYGLPPRRLGGSTGESMTYSTVEQDNLEYLTLSLRPWLVRLEYAITRCFPPGYYVKFGTEEMLRVDAKTKAEIDSLALGYQNTGWLSQDEVRSGYDKAPLPASQKPAFQHVPVAAAAQRISNKPTLVSVNGQPVNGNAPQLHNGSQTQSDSDTNGSGSSGANHALSQTRKNGRQAMLELYAIRTHDPIGRVEEPDYMRSRN